MEKTLNPESKKAPAFITRQPWSLLYQAAATVLVLLLLAGIVSERGQPYSEILAQGHRLPYADQLFIMFCGLFTAAVMLHVWFSPKLGKLYRLRSRLGRLRWAAAPVPALLVSWFFVFSDFSQRFDGFFTRLLFYLAALFLALWLVNRSDTQALVWQASLAGLVIYGVSFVLVYAFQSVVDFPFILSWSEGNRFYDYSVLFGSRLYDYAPGGRIQAFIDIGRQSLWGLPFLFSDISIQVMRFWSQFLFTVPYILLGWAFIRRRHVGTGLSVFFGLWALLFLNQGPIYTPLILAAVLVALTRRSPLWLAVPVVLFAGYYARAARFTWLFAPAMWAMLIAFLQTEDAGNHPWQRWIRTALLGLAGVLGGFVLPEMFPWLNPETGITVTSDQIGISSISQMVERQPLLWDRLWPSETYALGIVPGLALAAGPLLFLLIYAIRSGRWKLGRLQVLYLSGMSLAFLGVGLIISVKIGGGSNLHNLDMFLIGMLFTAGLFLENGGKTWLSDPARLPFWGKLLMIAVILYPATSGMFSVLPRIFPDEPQIEKALEVTRKMVSQQKSKGEILFMDHRQLLTFGEVTDVSLVTDYEKKLLMEMAMQAKADYFEGFYRDLAGHRFSLIISEPLFTGLQEEAYNFGSENNAWVQWVSIPILCYYEPVRTFPEVTLQILQPKAKSTPGPGLICPAW